MLMRLVLVLRAEAAGLAEENREDIKPLFMTYMPEMYNNQSDCAITVSILAKLVFQSI